MSTTMNDYTFSSFTQEVKKKINNTLFTCDKNLEIDNKLRTIFDIADKNDSKGLDGTYTATEADFIALVTKGYDAVKTLVNNGFEMFSDKKEETDIDRIKNPRTPSEHDLKLQAKMDAHAKLIAKINADAKQRQIEAEKQARAEAEENAKKQANARAKASAESKIKQLEHESQSLITSWKTGEFVPIDFKSTVYNNAIEIARLKMQYGIK